MLADFAKECKEKKLRAFFSYKSLKEVLAKYGIGGNSIGTIHQFPRVSSLYIDIIDMDLARLTFFTHTLRNLSDQR